MVQDDVCVFVQGVAQCVEMNSVMATKLSDNPFSVFPFDGIVGLGLPQLSLSTDFNFITTYQDHGLIAARQFAFYLAETGEGSELTLGGINPAQLDSRMRWVDVVDAHMGHWMVEIVGFHVGNLTLDLCREGGCRGVLDPGTSHIAIPSPYEVDVMSMLTTQSDGRQDCRGVEDYPTIVIELRGFNLTLHPQDYMRQMPLPSYLTVGSGRSSSTCRPPTPPPNATNLSNSGNSSNLSDAGNSSNLSDA